MIITNNENALRIHCEDVLPEEVDSLISILEKELEYANKLGKGGIGLAAPQIGIAKKIAIIRLGTININLVNAKITKFYDPIIFKQEGCLSFPGRVEDTTRYQEVVISNNLVAPHSFTATGLLSIVCQHELDHLNSSLFFDHAIKEPKKSLKVGPNEKCPCGSNKKYKKCCGRL